MKRLVIGILAHVDSGKTTLSEGILFNAGMIRVAGRVDHKNAFLDTNIIERERGITIFSKQALIKTDECEITLLDTPGHVDFCAETERTLQVLDYAILMVSASDGIQSHTRTLWKMLENHNIPSFIYINKMDLPNPGKEVLLEDIKEKLSPACIDFTEENDKFYESVAMCDESALDEYMSTEKIKSETISLAVNARKIIPCYFGSALKNEGVKEFFDGILKYTKERKYQNNFGAKIYKISEDEKGKRLTHLKVTGGELNVRDLIKDEGWNEKINEIRIYSGKDYDSVQTVYPGSICTVCGLTKALPGKGLGIETDSEEISSEAVFSYSVKLPDGYDFRKAIPIFKVLEEEETRLNVDVDGDSINIRIMGEVQLEVIKRILSERFSLDVEFTHGRIVYKETIKNTVEGVGHYEPLRHYAEVHLLLEPLPRGSGLKFESKCSDDYLDKNKRNLILTHLGEKNHLGVLTGSLITDMKISVVNGKAHVKHTEGGDFREATYRAVRQGLMQAESVLLEPWYNFILEVPSECTGRAMTDLEMMGARFDMPKTENELTVITGACPVVNMRDYMRDVIAYTRGRGRLGLEFGGYEECKNAEDVIKEIGYDCEADIENTADSVFCSHGSGKIIKWYEVFDHMHVPLLESEYKYEESDITPISKPAKRIVADDAELLKIFEKTYGKVKHTPHQALKKQSEISVKEYKFKPYVKKDEYLLIDGYNIIHAWGFLEKIAADSMDDARNILISKISTYRAMRQNNIILVFDAYKVKGGERSIEEENGISIVYTKEAETADSYIEKTSHELKKNYDVRVATSDSLEQIIIFGAGAVRVTPQELYKEVEEAQNEIREFIKNNNVPTHNI